MKLFRFVIASLLALVLVLSPALSYANSATATLPAGFQMPSVGDIAKRIGTRSNVVNYAVVGLLGAVDWVLDPANNRIVYKDPRDEIYSTSHIKLGMEGYVDSKDYEYIASLSCPLHGQTRVYNGKTHRPKHSHIIYVDCIDSVTKQPAGMAIFFAYNEVKHNISFEQVAEQIIKNAQAGHAESVDFVQAVANELKKQTGAKPIASANANEDTDTSNPDKEKDDGKDKPSKSDCDTAIKILEQYDRLAQKFGLKLSANKLKDLNNKRDAGIITIYDLPASLRGKFPARFTGMTLSEIRLICGKAK